MTKARLKEFRKTLEVKRSELAWEVHDRGGIIIEKSPDVVDDLQSARERELAISILGVHRTFFRGVEAALQRMDEGTFGICLCCGQEIAAQRLRAIPWTLVCIHCQEALERDEKAVVEFLQEHPLAPLQRSRDPDSNQPKWAA